MIRRMRDNRMDIVRRPSGFGAVAPSPRRSQMWKKVIAPTALVCLFWVTISGATTFYIFRLGRTHERILTENVTPIRAVASMQDALWRLQLAAHASPIPAGDARPIDHELEAQFERSLVAAEQSATSDAEIMLVRDIRRHFSTYRDALHGGANRETLAQLANAVATPFQELVQLNERMMTEDLARNARADSLLMLARTLALIAGPAFGIFLGIRIARGLDRSLSQIRVTLSDATGELDQEIGRVEITPLADEDDLSLLNRQVQAISTRVRQVLTELHNARSETVRSDRLALVGELAAGVAHELRNPLTSVKLLIQTAARNGTNQPPNKQALQIVLLEISRMERTIQGLLDFARPARLHSIPHDLRTTLRRALNLVSGRADHERVRIEEHFEDQPLPVDGDPEQLHQVFVNLLINGIESMPTGGTLRIDGHYNADSRTCRLEFTDAGGGIPLDLMDRIFEPFVTNKERGTGLGLAICRRIVQAHGGVITALNRPMGGAVFAVELPTCVQALAPGELLNSVPGLLATQKAAAPMDVASMDVPQKAATHMDVAPLDATHKDATHKDAAHKEATPKTDEKPDREPALAAPLTVRN